ncbi:MAG: ParB/RepB/Spo0J family partition protein [Actinomycetota bacterium]
MSWQQPYVRSTFDKARRKDAYRRLARLVTRRDPPGLLPLDEVTRRLRFFDQRYIGIRTIPVDRIVGTTDRTGAFSAGFLPRRQDMRQRWRRVEEVFPEGGFPPIVVYKLGDSYFVVDGHHRVAIARQRGMEFIDAEVTELRTRYELPADADVWRLIYLEQKRIFMEESGLDRARPEADIEFSRVDGYIELLEIVKIHGFHLMVERGEVLPIEEIGAHFYDHVYLPTVEAITAEGLYEGFRGRTCADLFLWVWARRRALSPHLGGMDTWDAAREAGKEQARRLKVKARRAAKKLAPKED